MTTVGKNLASRHAQDNDLASSPLLAVGSLSVRFPQGKQHLRAVSSVSFSMEPTESVAVVGESGSGKTTVLRAIAGLLSGQALISGSITLHGEELIGREEAQLRQLRGNQIGFIFQDPVNCFNPSMTIGAQLRRILKIHRPEVAKSNWDAEILSILGRVGIDGRGKLKNYPFQFSQGQLQRIMIAGVCLGSRPAILLADEPTTSLDVTTEAHVLELLRELRAESGMALLLVTHNLAVAAQICDRALVMYGGRVVEEASIIDLFDHPSHPYTRQLLKSLPHFPHRQGRLSPIPGELVAAIASEQGCSFRPRCAEVLGEICALQVPGLVPTGQLGQKAACHLFPAASAKGVDGGKDHGDEVSGGEESGAEGGRAEESEGACQAERKGIGEATSRRIGEATASR